MFFEKRAASIRGSNSGYSTTVLPTDWLALSSTYISAERAIRNSDVWTAVNIISSDVARTIFHSDEKKIDALLQSPSTLTNRFAFFQSMVVQLLLEGNSYAVRRTDGKNEWWEFVPPSGVTVWLSDDGQSLSYDINFSNPKEEKLEKIDANDVIHFRWTSLNGGVIGQSPLVALTNELDLQDRANKLSLSTIKRAITPTSILTTEARLKSQERDAAREQFEKANTGDNAGRVLVLDNLFKYSSVEVSADVAKILSSADYTRDQIAKAFMIPATMLGNEASHSNIDMIHAEYNQAFGRYLAAIVEELQDKLNGDISTDVHLINDMDSSGLETRVIALVTSGVISTKVAQKVLAKSPSDILNEDLINLLEATNTEKEGTQQDETDTDTGI